MEEEGGLCWKRDYHRVCRDQYRGEGMCGATCPATAPQLMDRGGGGGWTVLEEGLGGARHGGVDRGDPLISIDTGC